MTPRLLTIPFSHYCEKARWGADYVGYAYREVAYLPGVHIVPTRRAGGKTVPVLVTDRGTFDDSTTILEHIDASAPVDRKLYSTSNDSSEARRAIVDLEELFDTRLGPAARLLAYHHGLRTPAMLRRLLAPSMSPRQRVGFRLLLPLLGPQIRKGYRIDDTRAARAEETIREIFDTVSARLGESSGDMRYLVGDRFSAADLTFAALAAPVVMPPGHPAHPSDIAGETGPFVAFVKSLRDTPAGKHVFRMYREHRRVSAE